MTYENTHPHHLSRYDFNSRRWLSPYVCCRASFIGAEILLRQISPESEDIYRIGIGVYEAANGEWEQLEPLQGMSKIELTSFLEYRAMFLAYVAM